MATLLLQLVGPMQSWGTVSRFSERDTGKEPSKSGVLGLLAAALGIDRENWIDFEPLSNLQMGVRHDRPGLLRRDYQTAACAKTDTVVRTDGQPAKDGGIVSRRFYLADAAFLVGLSGTDRGMLETIHTALKNPTWTLFLGRKSFVPSENPWIRNGVQDTELEDTLLRWPWIAAARRYEKRPTMLMLSLESKDRTGLLKMDQPLSNFAERKFGARYVISKWIPFPEGGADVTS